MRHKSTQTKPSCQDLPETPEQKEIRLLTKRLGRAKQDKDFWMKIVDKRNEELKNVRDKLNATWAMTQGLESACKTYQRMYESDREMLEIAKKEALAWQQRYEELKRQKTPSNSHPRDTISDHVTRMLMRTGEYAPEAAKEPERLKKRVYLICIDPGDETIGLEYLERYTADAVEDAQGGQCYMINEMGGAPKFCYRFVLSTRKAHMEARRKIN